MSITFDKNGNPKPYKLVELTIERFEKIFTSIPDKKARADLISKYKKYILEFYQNIAPKEWQQWIGGSFTTQKEYPNDIDLVNFLDCHSAGIALETYKFFFTNKDNRFDSKIIYQIDGYCVPIFEENDPRANITKDKVKYWTKWFGYDREKNPKAILKVTLNDYI